MFPVLAGSNPSGYNLTRSVRLRSSASASLSRTFGSPTNNKIWTISVWAKRGNIGSRNFIAGTNTTGGSNAFYFDWDSDALEFGEYTSSWQWRLVTTQVFRDPSAWYHIVVAVDTTQATSSNRVKMYVNGSQVTAFSTASYPTQNLNTYWNQSGQAARFGEMNGASLYYDGYLAEINFIDGQALTPSSFGSINTLTGVWQPAPYTGTYGTNGFVLDFEDNSSLTTSSNVGLGKDTSGNGNYWTTNNISITSGATYDSMTDVPTLTSPTAGNFCVGNPLYVPSLYSQMSSRYANLDWGQAATNVNCSMAATFAMTTGKWYWEVTVGAALTQAGLGMQNTTNTAWRGGGTVLYLSGGNKQIGGATSTSYGASYTTNDVIGFAYDGSTGTLTCYKNNVSQGAIYSSGADSSWLPCIHDDNAGAGVTYYHSMNFGQRPFAYTPPTGFVSLNTFNLPTSTIVKGNTVMDVNIWTGNGTSQTITNSGSMKPDFFWIKSRSVNGYYHVLTDSVRGITKALYSNAADAENTLSTRITAINSNGFSLGTSGDVNDNAQTFVGWQWQAGQGTTSTNTSGTITSTVSVNASAGFSVVTFTAQSSGTGTVGHGLGVAPSLIITKPRANAYGWTSYHASLGNTQYIELNTTGAAATNSTVWNNTSPTSSVFTLGSAYAGNGTYVAYCWTPIAGYSAFGSYTGNGSSDGSFVYTGFRARWVLIKRTDTAGFPWWLLDTARNTYNVADIGLLANSSDSESSAGFPYSTLDFVSNGFKLRATAGGVNASGGTYIYMAFAENPLKFALAR